MENNIYIKLAKARVELHKMELKKSGENKFANFKYFELGDFLKQATECLLNNGLVGIFNTYKGVAVLKIYDESGSSIDFRKDFEDVEVKGANKIQNKGATSTYMKRYLYMDAMELAENDAIDRVDPKTVKSQPRPQQKQESKYNTGDFKETPRDTEIKELSNKFAVDIAKIKTFIIENFKPNNSWNSLSQAQYTLLINRINKGEI